LNIITLRGRTERKKEKQSSDKRTEICERIDIDNTKGGGGTKSKRIRERVK
jgi:hypothetical protein